MTRGVSSLCTLHLLRVCLFEDASPKVVSVTLWVTRGHESRGISCEEAAKAGWSGEGCSALVMLPVFWQAMTFRIPAGLWMVTLT